MKTLSPSITVSYLENKRRLYLLQDWTSVTLFITCIAHFPLQVLPIFPKNITATEAFPCMYYFQCILINIEGKHFSCCTEGTDRARHRMPLLFVVLHANPVSSRKWQSGWKSSDWPTPLLRIFLFLFSGFSWFTLPFLHFIFSIYFLP